VWIKYCGFTRREDLLFAASLGVDAAGFVFYEHSKRFIAPQKVRDISEGIGTIKKVGVFVGMNAAQVNETARIAKLDIIQLFAHEAGDDADYELPVLRVYRIASAEDIAKIPARSKVFLLDAMSSRGMGGTGESFDWSLIKNSPRINTAIIAGGISLNNAAEVAGMKPYGVDLSSSIEEAPGIKSHILMQKIFSVLKSTTQEVTI